ncbi:hypothetical protein SAMN04487776_11917 [Priestia megaterium]|nr:hypothetical protein SAMN04487776_11917 [Priestia megaterium]
MKKKTEKSINKTNQLLASSINIPQLLNKAPNKAIKVDENGTAKINYNDPYQKEYAEDWLK